MNWTIFLFLVSCTLASQCGFNPNLGVMNGIAFGSFIWQLCSIQPAEAKCNSGPSNHPQPRVREVQEPVVVSKAVQPTPVAQPACPPDTVKTSEGCKCKPGTVDIVDTNLPEKSKYKRGVVCIPDDPCHNVNGNLTVIFVVDSSGSIGEDWKHVLNFLKKAAPLIPNSSRVGFVKFSTKVTAAKWLKSGWTVRDFIAGIPAEFDLGFTNTGAAFNKAAQMLKNDRNERKVVILVTDGVPEILHDSPAKAIALANDAAKKLRASGDTILALGIGEKIKKGAALLKKWVVDQDKDYFAYHQAISMLSGTHMRNVMKRVCDTPSLHQLVKHRG